jgi:hypothetical protein
VTAERTKYLYISQFICLLVNENTRLDMTEICLHMSLEMYFLSSRFTLFFGSTVKTKVFQEPTMNDT